MILKIYWSRSTFLILHDAFPNKSKLVSSRLVVMLGWATSQIYPRVCKSIFITFNPALPKIKLKDRSSTGFLISIFRMEQSTTKYFFWQKWKKNQSRAVDGVCRSLGVDSHIIFSQISSKLYCRKEFANYLRSIFLVKEDNMHTYVYCHSLNSFE